MNKTTKNRNLILHQLKSIQTNKEYDIYIKIPEKYFSCQHVYPTLFVFDAEFNFGQINYVLNVLNKDSFLPDILIVGIAQINNDPSLRFQDYTPSSVKDSQSITGGADKFYSFIQFELFPFLDLNYRINKNDVIFFGHSLSGLFGLYTLFYKKSHLFSNYIIVSPSLWWDNGIIFQYENMYSQICETLDLKMFIAIGELEDKCYPSKQLVLDFKKFTTLLRKRKYFKFHFKSSIIKDELHNTVVPNAVRDGINWLYTVSIKENKEGLKHNKFEEKDKNNALFLIRNIYKSNNQSLILESICQYLKSFNIDDKAYWGRLVAEQYFTFSDKVQKPFFNLILEIFNEIVSLEENFYTKNVTEFFDHISRIFKYFPYEYKELIFESFKTLLIKTPEIIDELIIDFIEFIYYDLNKKNQEFCTKFLLNSKLEIKFENTLSYLNQKLLSK